MQESEEWRPVTSHSVLSLRNGDWFFLIFAPFGGDAFVALQFAIDFIGDLLQGGSERLGLVNRNRVDSHTRNHWIWQYPK
jgi:hypothetical protein